MHYTISTLDRVRHKSGLAFLVVLGLLLALASPAIAVDRDEVIRAQAILKQAEDEEKAAEAAKKAQAAKAVEDDDSDYSDRVDDLAGKVRTLGDIVGRTKVIWTVHTYYKTSAVSPLTPTAYTEDAYVGAFVDVEKFFEKNFTGMLTLRAQRPFGADDQVQLDILTARANYALSWLRVSLGRQSFAKFFTSNEFLGNFLTAGIQRMDAATVTIPLAFTTEVDDRGSYKSPPTAITYGYVPKLLSTAQTVVPSDISTAGYHFGQLRVAIGIESWGVENTIKLNVGSGASALLGSSPLGDGIAYSASYDMTVAKKYSIFYEYGIQNSMRSSTSAMVAGAKMTGLSKTLYIVDEGVFETLFPGPADASNALTGGMPQTYGVGAEFPVSVWYARVSGVYGKFEVGGAATNSTGDYTFGRIRQGSLKSPLTAPVGPVNSIDGHAVSLLANPKTPLAVYIYTLYHF